MISRPFLQMGIAIWLWIYKWVGVGGEAERSFLYPQIDQFVIISRNGNPQIRIRNLLSVFYLSLTTRIMESIAAPSPRSFLSAWNVHKMDFDAKRNYDSDGSAIAVLQSNVVNVWCLVSIEGRRIRKKEINPQVKELFRAINNTTTELGAVRFEALCKKSDDNL